MSKPITVELSACRQYPNIAHKRAAASRNHDQLLPQIGLRGPKLSRYALFRSEKGMPRYEALREVGTAAHFGARSIIPLLPVVSSGSVTQPAASH